MGRTVVTDLTPAQRKSLADLFARSRAIVAALGTPNGRAANKFVSYAETASEALATMRATMHGGGSLLNEGSDLSVSLFLTATANAERAWTAEGLSLPAGCARRLAGYREEYQGYIARSRFLPVSLLHG